MTLLPHIELNPVDPAQFSVIWLHGLGASGHDFEPVVPELKLPKDMAVRFIFPHAPEIPVTINGGYVMPAWYDILEMSIDRKIDYAQLMKSAAEIHKFIAHEISRGVAAERIVVAGFSQGGAVAYQAALTYPEKLAGLLGLSTYFATTERIEPHVANRDIAVEIHHGSQDAVVPEMLGKRAESDLRDRGYTVTYKTYAMEHEVCYDQIRQISAWLQARFS